MTIEQLRRAIVREVRCYTSGWRSNDIADEPAIRAAFNAYDKAVIAANKPITHRWNIELDGDDLLICDGSHDKGEECKFVRYARVADRPTFEEDEAPMINEQKVRYLLRSSGTELDRQALALLDAKDAEISEWRKLETATADARDAALSRAEQAEAEIARLKSKLADVEASEMGLLSNANAYHARAEQAEAALAERDAAIVGLMDCLIETVGTPRVEALHGKRLDAAYDAAKTFLPAPEPAVDPLVAVLEAAGYAVFPEDLERVRAAIERAGGVKAVFGEGV